MGFFGSLGQMFGLSKPKREGYSGETPYGAFHETQQGKYIIPTLQSRIETGAGTGFQPEVLTRAGNIATKSRLAGLEQRELPGIRAGTSARGLGRSSLAVAQEGQARAGAEMDIESRLAQMQLANEQQRKMEINQAIADMQNIARGDVASQANLANFQMGNWQQQQAQRQADEAAQQAGIMRMATLGGGMIGGGFGLLPGTTAGLTGVGQGALAGLSGDYGMFAPKSSTGATVNIGSTTGTDTSASSIATALANLSEADLARLEKSLGLS